MNPNRIWFYFRQGYSFYVASVLAPINTILLVIGFSDKLGINQDVLPWVVSILALVGIPGIILVGRLHYKRAYKNEVDVLALNNPYHFKLLPGHQKEVGYPLFLEMVRYLKVLNPSDSDRQKRLDDLEKKIESLLDGKSLK